MCTTLLPRINTRLKEKNVYGYMYTKILTVALSSRLKILLRVL